MTTVTLKYVGNLRTRATHVQSNSQITTDAPTDNQGQGEAFSPTDLVASALASCMMTIIGIKSNDMGIDLEGMTAQVTKVMGTNPRRITEIVIKIIFPIVLDSKSQRILEAAAHTCPVAQSLHEKIKQTITFHYPL